MKIKTIKVIDFRNYDLQEVTLSPDINIFWGDNAQGKTNLLEAIFLCAIGKSFRAKKEKELIGLTKERASVEVEYETKDRSGYIRVAIADKKQIFINGIVQHKMSDILGHLHIVMFSPDDIEMLKGGPANRRRFLNMMISQLRPKYVYCFNRYIKTLEQRNLYLKQMSTNPKTENMLEIWDETLIQYAKEIYQYRQEWVQKLKEKAKQIHFQMTQGQEELTMKYISDCEDFSTFQQALKKARASDLEKGYTSKGIHRDDIYFFINHKPVNVYGSQGQHRTVILSLKLAELEIIKEEIGEAPILLLDDYMSELDAKRRENFLKHVEHTQIIITCTDEFTISEKMCKTFHVQKGKVENKGE